MSLSRKDWEELVGKRFEVVSTIDHPYTSPPIHLVDGHAQLADKFGSSVLVINWDVSYPFDRTYRYDLITDTGLVAKSRELYHYRPSDAYIAQSFNTGPWELLPRCVEVAVSAFRKGNVFQEKLVEVVEKRALLVLEVSQSAWIRSDETPTSYTKELLTGFYGLWGQGELVSLIGRQYESYWSSLIRRVWIPVCIREATGKLRFDDLIGTGLFKRRPFRFLHDDGVVDIDDLNQLARGIERGRIVPSLDVFLWSLAVARVCHFGNDLGFFDRLSDITEERSFRSLQLTEVGEDCRRFLELRKDYGILLDVNQDGSVSASSRVSHSLKRTRISSFGSLFVALGEALPGVLADYRRGRFKRRRVDITE